MNPPHLTSYSQQYAQYGQIPQGQAQPGTAQQQQPFYYGAASSYTQPGSTAHPQQQPQQYYYATNGVAANSTTSAVTTAATTASSTSGSVTGSPASGINAGASDESSYNAQQQSTYASYGQQQQPQQPHHQHLHHYIQQQQGQVTQTQQTQTPYYTNQYPQYMQQIPANQYSTGSSTHTLQSQHSLLAAQQQHQQQQQHVSAQAAAVAAAQQQQQHQQQLQQAVITDPTGQTAPPGAKPKVTTTLWEDEGTLCFQVEAKGICVARREDNDMINGTKLLNVAGMTRGRRDGILKGEKNRHVVKAGAMHLKGVWIPYERALDFANKEKIIDSLYPLFVTDIKAVLYHPANYARTAQVLSAAAERRKDLAAAAANNSGSGSPNNSTTTSTTTPATGGAGTSSSSSYYYLNGQKETSATSNSSSPNTNNRKLPQLPNPPPSSVSPSITHQSSTNNASDAYSTAPSSRVGTPQIKNDVSNGNYSSSLPQINSSYYNSNGQQNGGQQQQSQSQQSQASGNEYGRSTTPLTDSLPHTPASNNLLHASKVNGSAVVKDSDSKPPVSVVSNPSNASPHQA